MENNSNRLLKHFKVRSYGELIEYINKHPKDKKSKELIQLLKAYNIKGERNE